MRVVFVFVDVGVGYGALIAAAWLNVFYIVVLAWAIYYLVASMATELPWASCTHWWNTANCRSYDAVCDDEFNITWTTSADDVSVACARANFTSPVREYWEYVLTHRLNTLYKRWSNCSRKFFRGGSVLPETGEVNTVHERH